MNLETGIISLGREEIVYCKGVPEKPKGIVVIVHGFAEHMGRYTELIQFLQEKGYGVYGFDHLGHGKSGKIRGHIDNFLQLVDSVYKIVQIAKENHPELPIVIFGHSMGGLVSAAFGIMYPDEVDGQILSAPALGIESKGTERFMLKLMRCFFPRKYLANKVGNKISKDSGVIDRYLNDELVLKEATLNFYYEVFIKGINYVKENRKKYCYPLLLLHGTEDKIIDCKLSQQFFKECSSQDKEIKIYEGLYHELLNEPEKAEVLEDIYLWLEKRVK
ncbi:alpha/beta hydrolase [Anaerobranca gottschalkii]|uniref:Monoacylglycerol lipase n=1 Tax=Anaerobranca gottschalkii DSM 13577 TaxID=1120990 RepID=A0A1I0CUI8_9FIRM|nr:alpha/beta hydrolase [Anaerobranca gottschalkii]SET23270.1 lysophospholipase [Anaerobranca gottschalkii DSM 13577]